MKNTKFGISLYVCLISLFVYSASALAGSIVPDFDDADAQLDITATTNNDDGVNAPDNSANSYVTFAAQFSLSETDIQNSKNGPVVIFENGGTSNGNGIYLSDGKFMFFIKNASRYGIPSDINDTDLTDGVALLSLAPAIADDYTIYVSLNVPDGIVISNINNLVKVFNLTVPAGINIDGNLTVTFLGLTPGADVPNDGSLGGLIEFEGDEAHPDFNPLWNWHNCMNVSEQTGSIRAQLFYAALDTVKYPYGPTPADNAKNIDPATTAELSFYAGRDPENPTEVNPDITGHFITVYDEYNGEPNLANAALLETFVAAGTDPVTVPYTFNLDDVVCWKVEEQISGAARGSASNITGPLWTFYALPQKPVVINPPVDTLEYPGETVKLYCDITSKTQADIFWYKQGQEDPIVSGADPDITIETDVDGESYSTVLIIADFDENDQGNYYCSASNTSGDDISAVAELGLKRLLAHWPMDSLTTGTEYNYYEDIVGGYHADPNVDPAPEQFKDGVLVTKTGKAIDLSVDGRAAASSGNWAPTMFTGEVSVCAWVYWEGVTSWQGIVSNRINTGADGSNFWVEIRPDGYLQIGGPNFAAVVADPLPTQEWVHLAITAGADGTVIYYNGIPVTTSTASVDIQQQDTIELNIGALDRDDAGGFASQFNGRLDEVKIFSYALSHTEVVDDYYPVSGKAVCVNVDNVSLIMDANGDCKVDILDLAEFTDAWLNNEFYSPNVN